MIPLPDRLEQRRVVCRCCHVVMDDSEPASGFGEFYHKKTFADGLINRCENAGKSFTIESKEVEPFRRKATRRALKHGRKS